MISVNITFSPRDITGVYRARLLGGAYHNEVIELEEKADIVEIERSRYERTKFINDDYEIIYLAL